MKMQGKIKAIPVKEVTEGMQVIRVKDSYQGFYMELCTVIDVKHLNLKSVIGGNVYYHNSLKEIKTFVVEYDVEIYSGTCSVSRCNQLPLKYSQWQAAIDNNEVDNDKIVTFEIIRKTGTLEYAKIIPQNKNNCYEATLSVGDGSGDLFVYGKYEAIKVLQEKLLKMEKMYTLQDVENIVTKLMHQVRTVNEDLIHDHYQYHTIDFKLSPKRWLEQNLQGLKIK